MNRGRNTAILAALATALVAYLFFVERHREPAPADAPDAPQGKVFAKVDGAKIEEIQIATAGGETTTLRKVDSAWRLVAPITAPADQTEATNAASNLASADVQRVVDEQPKDLATFGLATPRLTITFRVAGDKAPRTLLLGDKNPTGSDLYAKLPDAARVFLVSAYLEGTFDKGTFGFRDKRILAFDREKVDKLEVTAGAAKATVARQADTWSVVAPAEARADFGVIEAVLSRLANGQMKAVAWDPDAPATTTAATPATAAPGAAKPPAGATPAKHTFKEFGLDPAEHRLTLGAGSTVAELLLGKATPEGDVYAKDASRSIVFTIEKALADDLTRNPADFRAKDVFALRAFTATRLEIARAGTTTTFERKKGPEKDAVLKWVAVPPTPAADEAKIEDLVNKVATLRAESFVDALPAGAAEFARVQTAFEDGKKHDAVVIHQAGPDYYAVRQGEAGAGKLLAPAVTDIVTALDATKKPDAPKK
ncbi:MAG: DUF4340 domain-containing protein [Vicinamibacteraceae bacterium]